MNSGRRGEPPGKIPAAHSQQPLRILVVDICAPHWTHTCHQICKALENVLALAGSLAGPPRIPLLSIYVAQSQPECLLPFVPVRGGFAQLQRSLLELRALPTEGACQPRGEAVTQAVKDGLQQFKQLSGRSTTSASSLGSFSVEITVLTGQVGAEMVKQLEAGLRGSDLASLHQLQVVVIGRDSLPGPSGAEGLSRAREEVSCSENSTLHPGTAIDLQAVENDLVALETFFKAWLHDYSTDQEHLNLLLPACAAGASSACVKCDIQERLLSPSLLPTACSSSLENPDDATSPFWRTAGHSRAPHRLRIVRALKAEGLCASLLFGLPLIIRPTSCWQLNWDELEANQHSFQALCHCLQEREWALLARSEPWETGPGCGPSASSYQVLLPSNSASLLLQSVAVRELLLPCPAPPLPDEPPQAALGQMESILEGLQVEPTYNPLSVTSHLYGVLRSSLGKPQVCRPQRTAGRHLPRQQSSRQHQSKARAAVAPLRMAPPPASPRPLSLCCGEEEDFLDSP
ncbi:meiosis 1 arrest protein [Sphaerodactylus townsendi]|uniref:meiosis 1 arrest protein n=1 Tax=Sphaerodactylus townsendi TaxID=933632 RepID=UPI0020267C82|nr:meiosis 1 arrest protein [Sphaerodactylus townsendi]XP_048365799.1 meiosis 1 arrest protein [Sphaerodactylus townsendi]